MDYKELKVNPSSDLTLKQRKWLKVYLETGNATEAAMQSYDCQDRNSAKQIGYENLAKLDYSDLMEEAGITDKLLQDKIMEGLGATRTVSARITSKDADSRTDDFIDVEDYLVRHKYLETALKLKKRLIDRKDVTSDGQPLLPDIKVTLEKIYGTPREVPVDSKE